MEEPWVNKIPITSMRQTNKYKKKFAPAQTYKVD